VGHVGDLGWVATVDAPPDCPRSASESLPALASGTLYGWACSRTAGQTDMWERWGDDWAAHHLEFLQLEELRAFLDVRIDLRHGDGAVRGERSGVVRAQASGCQGKLLTVVGL
jgi:hypothetical protein